MASAQFRPTEPGTIAQLVRRFPSVSIFDMDDLLSQVRSIIDKAVLAVQSVFIFTLLAGVVVLLAAVQATRDERRYESAMLRTLGARDARCWWVCCWSSLLIGVLAGADGRGAASSVASYFIATRLLEIPYPPGSAAVAGRGARRCRCWCASPATSPRAARCSQPPMSTLRYG